MKIKILHMIETLSRGGAERRLINDLKYLDKNIFSHIVCHLFNGCELEDEIKQLGIPVYDLGVGSHYAFGSVFFRFKQLVREHRPDIIHTQLFAADVYGRFFGKLLKLPVVSTVQSSIYEPGIDYFRSPKRLWFDSISGRLCNRKFIAVSDFVKKSVIRRLKFKQDKIEVIYNYVDVSNFIDVNDDRLRLRKNNGFNQEDVILINVAKLNPPKGHAFLFEALALLNKRLPFLKLIIVGDGPSKKDLVMLRDSLGLKEVIIFLGQKDNIKDLLLLSDIFVFPSLSEGCPVSLLEAMVSAKPCVAFDIGPISEIIENGKTGLLVEPRNSQALAKALILLLNDHQLAKEIGNKARDAVLEKFSPKQSVKRLERLYKEIINHR